MVVFLTSINILKSEIKEELWQDMMIPDKR